MGTAITRIDLNSDLGEGFGPYSLGDDAARLAIVTSANVAAGGHASDPDTMAATLAEAARRGVVIGAHPGYADRAGFGRRVIPMQPDQIGRMVLAQTGALSALAQQAGTVVRYVKPHGALGNLAAADADVARAIASAVAALSPRLAILAISGTALEHAARAEGVEVFSEIFADRAYLADGQLVPRSRPGSVLHDAGAIADRLLGFLGSGRMPVLDGGEVALAAHSICVHSDTPGAVAIAQTVHQRLSDAGVTIAPFLA